jgi:hypothetical protein
MSNAIILGVAAGWVSALIMGLVAFGVAHLFEMMHKRSLTKAADWRRKHSISKLAAKQSIRDANKLRMSSFNKLEILHRRSAKLHNIKGFIDIENAMAQAFYDLAIAEKNTQEANITLTGEE